ncbi:MAG: hypothetical protein ACI9HI_000847, partial [Salinirussus sp.]
PVEVRLDRGEGVGTHLQEALLVVVDRRRRVRQPVTPVLEDRPNLGCLGVEPVECLLGAVECPEQRLVLGLDGVAHPVQFLREKIQRARHRTDLCLQELVAIAHDRGADLRTCERREPPENQLRVEIRHRCP